MKKLLIAIGVLITLLLAVLFIVPSLVPSSVYKDKIQTQLSSELGRDVLITGDVKLSTFPLIKAKTDGVTIKNPEGFTATDFAQISGLEARVKLLPLFSKRVEISRFTLRDPIIRLEKRADGVANWEFGDRPTEPKPDTGPFKRDGRMAALDPQIGAFTLENGTLTYDDAVTGQSISVTDINTFVSLPSMAKTLIIDGSLVYDDMPLTLDLAMNSPRAFLNGQSATIEGNIKTDFASAKVDGSFLPSEAIAFAANIDGNVSDLAALKPFLGETALGETAKYVDLAKTASLIGDIRYEGETISAENTNINIEGDALTFRFAGNARMADVPTASGDIALNITDLTSLKSYLPQDVKGLDLLKTVDVTAKLQSTEQGVEATALDAKFDGPSVAGSYTGTASYNAKAEPKNAVTAKGQFKANSDNPAKLAAIFAPDVQGAAALGATSVSGTVDMAGQAVRATNISFKTEGNDLRATYSGDASFVNGKAAANGNVDANIADLPALTRIMGLTIENIDAVKTVAMKGSVNYSDTATSLKGLSASLTNGAVNGTYEGDATLGEIPAFDGAFTATIPQLAKLDQALTMDIPYDNAIGQLAVSGKIKGSGQNIDIKDIIADLTQGLLNGSYRGSATYNDGVTLDGQLDATITSLRELAKLSGTDLPPSTAAGDIFGAFAMNGTVKGTPQAITLSQANIALDQIKTTGQFGVDLTTPKPFIDGTLNVTSGLDLRPYMESFSAQRPEGQIVPWSDTPINTEPFRAVNAKIVIATPNIKMTRLTLGETTINTTLNNGVLSTVMPSLSLYGGRGTMTATLDASSAVPAISLDTKLDKLQTNSFMSAVAGFANASGQGQTALKVEGRGISQAAIMKSLNGTGGFEVLEGTLKGINASEFLTGLDSALTSRSLPSGIGADQVTQFQDLVGKFQIENGVLKVGTFKLAAANLLAEGDGEIDLGNQTLDLRFLPKLRGDQASGLAAFGIPIRFSGGFGSAKASLDTEFLGQIVTNRARAEAGNILKKELGGGLGDIVGGIIGGQPTPPNPAPENGEIPPATTPTESKSPSDAVEGMLGELLGVKKAPAHTPNNTDASTIPTETAPSQTQPVEKTDEEKIEDALGSLFGRKKKTKSEDARPNE
ncbi:AsmA family protein [Litorimonas sp. RW-G-Af-16]|uniref:AsmA family protein n=1 Tax=Litorimonas sp. RW-G-Af-16 TaxID=3241168 RepID=UPI00390C757E